MKASGVLRQIWRWVRWPVYIVLAAFVLFVGWGTKLAFDKDKTDAAVVAIHAQKLTLADVEGKNLPPVPDQAENDATVAGLDKNNNGVRDDVELAIFKKYPNSAKIRAAELQYAMATQMMIVGVSNTDTWIAAAEENSRAAACIGETVPDKNLQTYLARKKEVENLVVNTAMRKNAENAAYKFTTSFSLPNTDLCNVDLTTLPN